MKNLVLGKRFDHSQQNEFFEELKKKANDKEILTHMWGSFINYYAGDYDSDNRIGQDSIYDGFYLFEESEE